MSKRSLNSFTGIIDEIPQISVDNFANLSKKAYFLSHCHTDHTNGLFSPDFIDNLARRNICVYMSEASAAIVKYETTDCRIERFIKPLPMGRSSIILTEDSDKEILNTTLIPAGHCFGSVMFLFNINNRTVLYSGDFRIRPNDVSKYAHLHRNGDSIYIDAMYVDTTFQSVMYKNFPKRMDCIQYVIDEVKRWMVMDESNMVALHTSAKYGYEFVFNEIYKSLRIKVFVNERKWELYRNFQSLVPGVTDQETRIHLCANRNEKRTHDNCVKTAKGQHFLYIHLSAMIWSGFEEEKPFFERRGCRLNVCFATHCSRSELVYFIEYMNPKRVIGFPEPFKESPSKITSEFKVTPKKRKVFTNKTNELRKVNRHLLKEMFDL